MTKRTEETLLRQQSEGKLPQHTGLQHQPINFFYLVKLLFETSNNQSRKKWNIIGKKLGIFRQPFKGILFGMWKTFRIFKNRIKRVILL